MDTKSIDPTVEAFYLDRGYKAVTNSNNVPYNVRFIRIVGERSDGNTYSRTNELGINVHEGVYSGWTRNFGDGLFFYKVDKLQEPKNTQGKRCVHKKFGDLVDGFYTGAIRRGVKSVTMEDGIIVMGKTLNREDSVTIYKDEWEKHVWNLSGEDDDVEGYTDRGLVTIYKKMVEDDSYPKNADEIEITDCVRYHMSEEPDYTTYYGIRTIVISISYMPIFFYAQLGDSGHVRFFLVDSGDRGINGFVDATIQNFAKSHRLRSYSVCIERSEKRWPY